MASEWVMDVRSGRSALVGVKLGQVVNPRLMLDTRSFVIGLATTLRLSA